MSRLIIDPAQTARGALDRMYPKPHPYLENPAGWVRERLREPLWSGQVAILEAVRDHPKVVVVTCNGVGKDWTGARAAGWWVDVHPADQTLVATTAPSGDQVKGIIWQELVTVKAGGNSDKPLAGRVNQTNWWNGPHQVGIGRKTSDYSAATVLGFHADFLLIIIDEAQGVTAKKIQDFERLATADDVPGQSMQRILAIGNPDYEGSTLERMCRPNSGWHVIQLGYDETPNFTGEAVPVSVSSHLIGKRFVEERERIYGVDSPTYIAQVLGKFPGDRKDGVVPWSWVKKCQSTESDTLATDRIGPLRIPVELGVDVAASENGDWTVIAGREGQKAMSARSEWRLQTDDPDVIVRACLDAVIDTRATSVKVDYGGGFGFAIVKPLRRALATSRVVSWAVAVLPVNVAKPSAVKDERGNLRFFNVKAEIWWEVGRELSRRGLWDLTELDDDEVAQLTDVRWYEDEKTGLVKIEKKSEVKARTGRSPDDADARLLSFYTPLIAYDEGFDDVVADQRGRR